MARSPQHTPGTVTYGSLDLEGSSVTTPPERLTVHGRLNLRGSRIASLPVRLKVESNPEMADCQISELPDYLWVGGNLNIERAPITAFPKRMRSRLSAGGVEVAFRGRALAQIAKLVSTLIDSN